MARIEWVKQRLENWALWKEREQSGGLGFSSSAAFLREVVDGGSCRDSKVPVDDVDASVTDQAVESLRGERDHLYVTLHNIYPRGLGIREAARRAGRAESTIKAQLEQADHALRLWFNARSERQALARQQVERVQELARP